MSSTSAMACSFTPGDRQPRRSNARIRMSRSDNSGMPPPPGHGHCDRTRRPRCPGSVPASTGNVRSRIVAHFRYLSFLTDYGLEDGFVAACHGVSARIAPHAGIIDVTHLIPPGDIRRGAAVLAQTVPYLPPAVHVAVVDPGVGTARRGIAVAAGDSVFIGPDNGLLSWAVAEAGGATEAVSLTNRALWLDTATATFHGRDIFMPAAAHLAAGVPLARAGDQLDVGGLVTLPRPTSRITDGRIDAEVLTVDRFGNAQLSVTGPDA